MQEVIESRANNDDMMKLLPVFVAIGLLVGVPPYSTCMIQFVGPEPGQSTEFKAQSDLSPDIAARAAGTVEKIAAQTMH
ncbi:MAG: hypothetical protein AB8B58_06050 [Roseobacter sp.]